MRSEVSLAHPPGDEAGLDWLSPSGMHECTTPNMATSGTDAQTLKTDLPTNLGVERI